MPELPERIRRLDLQLAAATIAHERIADIHLRLSQLGTSDQSDRLLRKSASIMLAELPALLTEAVDLRRRWEEQELLDPGGAASTAEALSSLLDRLEPELARLRRRRRQIFEEMRRLLAEAQKP